MLNVHSHYLKGFQWLAATGYETTPAIFRGMVVLKSYSTTKCGKYWTVMVKIMLLYMNVSIQHDYWREREKKNHNY